MLVFLQEKMSLQNIRGLERKLEGFRGEKINREYWEEVFQYPYDLDRDEVRRILDIYDIEIIEDI